MANAGCIISSRRRKLYPQPTKLYQSVSIHIRHSKRAHGGQVVLPTIRHKICWANDNGNVSLDSTHLVTSNPPVTPPSSPFHLMNSRCIILNSYFTSSSIPAFPNRGWVHDQKFEKKKMSSGRTLESLLCNRVAY